ncbi:MAG: histidinol dehydrogenase [Deltaproteobacteria bacterium]|nr:histidinol dehydrogenase [Deltaproteobacteria bacterium]
MLRILLPDEADYHAEVARLLDRGRAVPPAVEETVRAIVADVQRRGDEAVREYCARFDGGAPERFELRRDEIEAAAAAATPEVRAALERAAARIRAFHERQRVAGYDFTDADGVHLGLRVAPLGRVGLYVPGGTARYPSSVLMTAVPAKVAGVPEVVMTTPGPSPETLAAALIAGVDRVFTLGGAQAIAALAYGTRSVPRVDKIVGPGNAWVTAAKRLVYGAVDIDAIAGPSEVLIVADETAEPAWCAADLLAQAEHDPDAVPVLVTTSAALAAAVARAVETQLADLPRRAIAAAALAGQGRIVVVADVAAAVRFANEFAAEHLELQVRAARAALPAITAAGAVFVGPFTTEALGDYFAGPNHVLPTAGTARWASALGVHDFVRQTTVLEYDRDALQRHAADVQRLAQVEGLDAHGRAVAVRLGPGDHRDR